MRDTGLAFGRPRHIVAKEGVKLRGGAPLVGLSGSPPSWIGVGGEGVDGADIEVKVNREVALHVLQNPLDQCNVMLTRAIHEQVDLLDSIRKVWLCQGELL